MRYARLKDCRSPLVFDANQDMTREAGFYDANAQETVDVDSDGNTVYTDSENGSASDSEDDDTASES